MMDVLLNFGQDATSTQLQTQLYYADTPGSMDHTDPTNTPINAGLIKHCKRERSHGHGGPRVCRCLPVISVFAKQGRSQTETVPVQECIPT